MKHLLGILGVILLTACQIEGGNNTELNLEIPTCIEILINDHDASKDLRTVRAQVVDGKHAYWLNTDLSVADSLEAIVSGQCDTICMYCGFCEPRTCSKKYQLDDWVTIWKK